MQNREIDRLINPSRHRPIAQTAVGLPLVLAEMSAGVAFLYLVLMGLVEALERDLWLCIGVAVVAAVRVPLRRWLGPFTFWK